MSKKIVIDAGHGGDDSGAVGNGIVEKEYTLKISEYIHKRLDELGVPNVMVRAKDETLSPDDRVKRILSFYGNGLDVIVLSNHINAGGGKGSEIIYALRNNDSFSKKISFELESIGRDVRKYYQRRLPNDTSKDYYFIHRNTSNTEAIIVEYGFLDNEDDAKLLKNNWERYAEAVVKGLCEYIGIPYVFDTYSGYNDYYVVSNGDTLWSIAKKYGLSVDELKKLNNLSSNLINVGQKLLVSNSGDCYYYVKKGDTLYSLAKKYNITVDKLKDINNLKSNTLSVNQKLLIKENCIVGNNLKYYEVKKGDTLYKIAMNNGTTVTELININNLPTTNLSIGQLLILP